MKSKEIVALLLLSTSVIVTTSCSSTATSPLESSSEQQPAAVMSPKPAAAPMNKATGMEGGIVGTGNEDDCKNSENKEACNDNVK